MADFVGSLRSGEPLSARQDTHAGILWPTSAAAIGGAAPIVVITPAAGSISAGGAVAVQITATTVSPIRALTIVADFADTSETVAAMELLPATTSLTYKALYAPGSTSTVDSDGVTTLSVRRDGIGWYGPFTFRVLVDYVSAAPELDAIETTAALTAPAAPVPVITLESPLTGRVDRFTQVVFTVTAGAGLVHQTVSALFPSGENDVIHDGVAFASEYAGSARAPISGGYRYTVIKTGGWPESPTIRVKAVDARGQVV